MIGENKGAARSSLSVNGTFQSIMMIKMAGLDAKSYQPSFLRTSKTMS